MGDGLERVYDCREPLVRMVTGAGEVVLEWGMLWDGFMVEVCSAPREDVAVGTSWEPGLRVVDMLPSRLPSRGRLRDRRRSSTCEMEGSMSWLSCGS